MNERQRTIAALSEQVRACSQAESLDTARNLIWIPQPRAIIAESQRPPELISGYFLNPLRRVLPRRKACAVQSPFGEDGEVDFFMSLTARPNRNMMSVHVLLPA